MFPPIGRGVSSLVVTMISLIVSLTRALCERPDQTFDPRGQLLALEKIDAADLAVLLPGDQGQLVTGLDPGSGPYLLGQDHLAALVDRDYGFHLERLLDWLAFAFCFILARLGHKLPFVKSHLRYNGFISKIRIIKQIAAGCAVQ